LLPATIVVLILLTSGLYVTGQQSAQAEPTPQETPAPSQAEEKDPTKPIVFSIRDEYRDLKNGAWANTAIFRADRLSFRNFQNRGGAKGLLLRIDVPLNIVHVGSTTKFGLGDTYGQILYIP